MKRLPPYAMAIRDRLKTRTLAGRTIWIAAGRSSWEIARGWKTEPSWRGFLALPPDATPDDYDWSIVKGFDCTVIGDLERVLAERLATALIFAGAPLAVFVGGGRIISFRPVMSEAA